MCGLVLLLRGAAMTLPSKGLSGDLAGVVFVETGEASV